MHKLFAPYRVHQEQAHSIKCYALDGSPAEPTSLVRHKKILEATVNKRGHVKKQKQADNQQSGDDKSRNVQMYYLPHEVLCAYVYRCTSQH